MSMFRIVMYHSSGYNPIFCPAAWRNSGVLKSCATKQGSVSRMRVDPGRGYAPAIRLKMAISGRHPHIHTDKTDISR